MGSLEAQHDVCGLWGGSWNTWRNPHEDTGRASNSTHGALPATGCMIPDVWSSSANRCTTMLPRASAFQYIGLHRQNLKIENWVWETQIILKQTFAYNETQISLFIFYCGNILTLIQPMKYFNISHILKPGLTRQVHIFARSVSTSEYPVQVCRVLGYSRYVARHSGARGPGGESLAQRMLVAGMTKK